MNEDDRSEAVTVESETCTLHVPNLGFTLRTLLGAAANGYKLNPQRRWKLVYKGARIGMLTLKDTHLKVEDDSNGTGVKRSPAKATANRKVSNHNQGSDTESLGVGKGSPRRNSKGPLRLPKAQGLLDQLTTRPTGAAKDADTRGVANL